MTRATLRLIFAAALLGALLVPSLAAAEDDAPGAVSAVQERTYKMQHEIDLAVGVLPLDPFSKGLYAQGGYALHFTDAFGIQVRGAYVYTTRTDLRVQLERDFGVLPNEFEQVVFFAGGDLMWTPLYGKLSVLNRWVVHGEAFLLAGATAFRFNVDKGITLRPAVNLGGGLRIFVTRWFGLRFDLTNAVVLPLGKATSLANVMTVTLNMAFNLGATE